MAPRSIVVKNNAIRVAVLVRDDGGAAIEYILPATATLEPFVSKYFADSLTPSVELRLSGEGNAHYKSAKAMLGSYVGRRLKYRSYNVTVEGSSKTLDVELHDEKTGVTATSHLKIFEGVPFVQARVSVPNDAGVAVTVVQMPSIVVGGLTRSNEWWHDYEVSYANNTWFREAQWVTRTPPDMGIDDFGIYGLDDVHESSIASFALSNHSSFSTQRHLPIGILRRKDQTETWMWQVESSGSWKWEIGDYRDNVYLVSSGPNSDDHEWRQSLAPGESFTSVPVAVGHLYAGTDATFAALTQYRRCMKRPHPDHQRLPIIFNDYMNCLMGDPTTEKVLALVEPAAKSGAEYFVIDCGWYADDGNWWDDVGVWEPSKKRFPNGFTDLLDKIRQAGLIPGLWIEPEVICTRSVMANRLPNEAFFQRDGQRIVEKNRYQLDYRHPDVIKRMDSVIARCVKEYGAGYFKFDYNVEVTQGTDVDTASPGAAQLEHGRAYLAWVSRLLDRYPGLVIENCSSGAQRMDYAQLAVHTLQSTSDQQSPEHYAVIAAAIPTAVIPEQGARWAYPQAEWPDEINALTVTNNLLGRIHLGGRLDTMKAEQLAIVREGMQVYQSIRADIPNSVPFWPLGLPKWHDNWLALGLKVLSKDGTDTGRCYVSVWRRGGSTKCSMPIAPLQGQKGVRVEFLYPKEFRVQSVWDDSVSALNVKLPEAVSARLFRLQATNSNL
ncbi:hypothetical protein LTR95_001018 [Oleoguttula sp. CCFEE 5521]